MRCFFSLSSTSVCAPTLMTQTPPASLARRSLSFSRSQSLSVFSISARICATRSATAWWSPPPSTMVESSLVTTMRRAVPSTSRPTWSSLRPTSGVTTWAPVRIARSCRIALRRSPNAGALTATEENVPRMRFTTRVDSASPSTSSATMNSGLPAWTTFSSSGSRSETVEILFCTMQDVGVLEDGLHALGVGDEVGRDVALVELHALGEVELERGAVGLLDRDDAVLADLVERLGDELADRAVLRGDGRDVRDLVLAGRPARATSSRRSLTAVTALSMPRLRSIGAPPAVTTLRPSRTIACARTVAVVVPSPATSLVLVATSLASWAPRFSYESSSSTSRAMVTPSLVIVGAPHFLSMTTLRPFGPSVTLTASASALTPRSRLRRASSSNSRILAMGVCRSFVCLVAFGTGPPRGPEAAGADHVDGASVGRRAYGTT